MTVDQLSKIDSREVYGNDVRIDCDCNADKACVECVDGGLYDGPLTDDEARAMHTLMHCEDEQNCAFCNGQLPPPPEVIVYMDGQEYNSYGKE